MDRINNTVIIHLCFNKASCNPDLEIFKPVGCFEKEPETEQAGGD
jgi:hypothetical protein